MMFKRWGGLLIGLVGLLILVGSASAQGPVNPQHSDPTWQAWYWNNTNLAGSPVLQRNEANLSYNWGQGSPDPAVNADGFSARWTRYVEVPDGTYRFTVSSDDGVRLWVDGVLIIDAWYEYGTQALQAERQLPAGHHLVVVEYYENTGNASIQVSGEPAAAPIYNWRGEYFNNTSLSGGPALVRDDAQINFDWGNGSPAPGPLGVDNFSVRWTRTVDLAAGYYRFSMTVDDGGRLWVNDHLLIDSWRVQAPTTFTGEIYLAGGRVPIKMEYYEAASGAVARLSWVGGETPLPTPPPTPGPTPDPFAGWIGQYYPNPYLSGPPAQVRLDNELNFNWRGGAPLSNFPADNFSVRWTRDVYLPGNSYTFTAQHDDGVRVWVDGVPVIDAWYDQATSTHQGTIRLRTGMHRLQVDYYEHLDQAVIGLWWQAGGVQPPPPPPPPGPGGVEVLVDNTDQGFQWGGPLQSRYVAKVGFGGSTYWTYNSTSYPANYGRWTPGLPTPGKYEIFVYVPGNYASSTSVRYRIIHNNQRHDLLLNQSRYGDQWVSLGTFYFSAGNTGREFVLVYDNTGEPYTSRAIAFDAVRFVLR